MATRVTFDLTFDILQRELNDIVTLTEEELADGVRLALDATHHLAEGAGAAALAAAVKLARPAARQARRLRDERRQHRPGHADADPGDGVGSGLRAQGSRPRAQARAWSTLAKVLLEP